jgi:hypothetical protein
MNYLVFYSMNAQRKSHFRRVDEIRCTTAYANPLELRGGAEYARCRIAGRWKKLFMPIVFDLSTTPPTIKNATITNVAHWSQRHPSFPKFYISPVGHIRESATDKLVMSP